MEKESWLKIEDLTNSSSLSNYTSCPAQTKLQNSITQNTSVATWSDYFNDGDVGDNNFLATLSW